MVLVFCLTLKSTLNIKEEDMKKLHIKLARLLMLVLALFLIMDSDAIAENVTISYSDWQLAQDIGGRSLREAIAEF